MEVLTGYKIDNFPITKFQKIGDLDYFEGPSLSLFKSEEDNSLYLFDWVDCDNEAHRWLVYAVSPQQLTQFIARKLSRYDLFFGEKKVNIVDLASNFRLIQAYSAKISVLPQTYFPNKNSFFDLSESPQTDMENIQKTLNMLMPSFSSISKKRIFPQILRGISPAPSA